MLHFNCLANLHWKSRLIFISLLFIAIFITFQFQNGQQNQGTKLIELLDSSSVYDEGEQIQRNHFIEEGCRNLNDVKDDPVDGVFKSIDWPSQIQNHFFTDDRFDG